MRPFRKKKKRNLVKSLHWHMMYNIEATNISSNFLHHSKIVNSHCIYLFGSLILASKKKLHDKIQTDKKKRNVHLKTANKIRDEQLSNPMNQIIYEMFSAIDIVNNISLFLSFSLKTHIIGCLLLYPK